jgi:hypothetical protein
MKALYCESIKLKKETELGLEDGKTSHIHGLVEYFENS